MTISSTVKPFDAWPLVCFLMGCGAVVFVGLVVVPALDKAWRWWRKR